MINLSTYLSLLFAFAMCAFSFFRLYDKYMDLQQQNAELRQAIKDLKEFLEKELEKHNTGTD